MRVPWVRQIHPQSPHETPKLHKQQSCNTQPKFSAPDSGDLSRTRTLESSTVINTNMSMAPEDPRTWTDEQWKALWCNGLVLEDYSPEYGELVGFYSDPKNAWAVEGRA